MNNLHSIQGTIPAAQINAAALLRLLGGSVRGSVQSSDGAYYDRRELDINDLEKHFSDEITVAVEIVQNKRARLLAFDLDRHFAPRLGLIAGEIRKRGLEAATICTTGSDADRGKILVFFARAMGPSTLQRLSSDIVSGASKDVAWGMAATSDLSVFPQLGQGGLLRIGGRNRHPERNALALDNFFGLDGDVRSLATVIPAKLRRSDPIPVAPAPLQPWVERFRSEPWTWDNGSAANYRKFLSLAAEAQRVYGPSAGFDVLRRWADEIWRSSPEIHRASPSGDKRSQRTFDRWRSNAWKRITALKTPHYIAPEEGRDNESFYGSNALRAIEAWAVRKGLTLYAIGLSTRTLASIMGRSQKTARRQIAALEASGRLVVIDRGIPGNLQAPMIVGIVRAGETPAEVRKRAAARGNVIGRQKLRHALADRQSQQQSTAAQRLAS